MDHNENWKQEEPVSLEEQISGIKEQIDSPYWKFLNSRSQQNWLNQLMDLEKNMSARKRSRKESFGLCASTREIDSFEEVF